MTSTLIVSRLAGFKSRFSVLVHRNGLEKRPDLYTLARDPDRLPWFVRQSPVAMRYLDLLGSLAWDRFPERNLAEKRGTPAVPYAPFAAACLIKLDQGLVYMSQLRQYLCEHPPLVWLLGFPLVRSLRYPWSFDAQASLPTPRHFTRLLREIPNATLQFLLDSSVHLLQAEFRALETFPETFGECIAMDTKHILAWVRENNPKTYVPKAERYDKNRQPKGDPDCRLGCKRKTNQPRNRRASSQASPATPADNPLPADTIPVGEYYWGYASGLVTTKLAGWGEFILAELTQAFDQPDVSYFFPLMADIERRLGFRPRFGAFDAFYVYEYFHHDDEGGGFAAIPFSERGGYKRQFNPDGLPLCQAGLPMPLKYKFWSKTTLIEHQRGRHVCPLLFPEVTGQVCPIDHKQWPKGGCTTTMPTSIGARIRYQLDRQRERYKQVYQQRTATERINSQAKELGIERPRIRNGKAIANLNTLIYVLINLRAWQRVRQKVQSLAFCPSDDEIQPT